MNVDFIFTYHGSLWLVEPQNAAAREHLVANVSDEAQWFGHSLAVEARYVGDLAQGLQADGFVVGA